jgi:glutathione S-transferase
MGRGELVNLLLKDSGLKYEYDIIYLENFKANKHELVAAGLVQPTIPYLIANGKYYGKAYPILRFLSRKLGKYDGKTDDEIQFVDALADAINDWYTKWGTAIYGGQERHVDGRESFIDTYNNETFPASLKDFDAVLAKSNGPYLIGEEVKN